ncbi:MAG TPA: response regulator [Sphingomonas sp.]|jgi:CheY-like chemotaxis protein|nr:response regulator [Sphingomonas sp.]
MLADSVSPSRRLVLIVDDEPLVRKSAAMMVDEAGYESLQAGSADEAIDLLAARDDIFVVFTDVEMPGRFDGSKLAAYAAGLWPPVHVVITSGRVAAEAVPMANKVSFLSKPYRVEDLAERFGALAI